MYMLIVVSGLDTYRSLERARFLESAYRQKYDPKGSSIERLSCGKDAIDPLLSICVSGSLFSSRRFIRADGIITSCPKAKRDALIKALSHDAEMTIVLCREDGVIKDADLKLFSAIPGFKHDRSDPMNPRTFFQWALDHAKAVGYTNEPVIRRIAEASNGDSWAFISELGKVSCGGEEHRDQSQTAGSFDVINALAEDRNSRFSLRRQVDEDEGVIALSPQQARSLLMVAAGAMEHVPFFVAQKIRAIHCTNSSDFFERVMSSFIWSRSGFTNAEEALDVLG
jgi:hypothetical protein